MLSFSHLMLVMSQLLLRLDLRVLLRQQQQHTHQTRQMLMTCYTTPYV
jgi:hypothetical protein